MTRSILWLLILVPGLSPGEEALIAVATNFQPVMQQLADDFQSSSPHRIRLSSGSTGLLFAQIKNGAPFDAFFAADQVRPAALEASGLGVAGSRFTYAEGRLAFWSNDPALVRDDFEDSLRSGRLRVLAIANPDLAPYGQAARSAIEATLASDPLVAKQVFGENVGQAFSLVATGNADAGVIALSAVIQKPEWLQGAYLEVPADLHPPIRQDAVLLRRGKQNEAAIRFLAFLQEDAVRKIIKASGYR